jgi:hypothetical protein
MKRFTRCDTALRRQRRSFFCGIAGIIAAGHPK